MQTIPRLITAYFGTDEELTLRSVFIPGEGWRRVSPDAPTARALRKATRFATAFSVADVDGCIADFQVAEVAGDLDLA